MICKECQEKKYKRMLAEADKAMKRYTAKLKVFITVELLFLFISII